MGGSGVFYNNNMVYKCKYFGIKELVSPVVYNKWGEQAWMFFKESTLRGLDIIRETYNSPIIINNWASGGSLKQCGLRSNLDEIPLSKTKRNSLYLSAHCMGKGFDLHDKYGHNQKLWQHCYDLIKQNKTGDFKRIENWNATSTGGGWVHVDCFNSDIIVF